MSQRLKVLHLVRALIEEQREDYICDALGQIGTDFPELESAADNLGDEIRAGIDHAFSMSIWLLRQLDMPWQDAPAPYRDLHEYDSPLSQAIRLAWLDKLISDIEEAA